VDHFIGGGSVGPNCLIDLTGNAGATLVIGANDDTIIGGGGATNIQATDGDILIMVGAGGTTNISGNLSQIAGNTIIGGAGNLVYNPYLAPGGDIAEFW